MSQITSEAIQVVLRIRPMQKYEESRGDKVCVKPIADGKGVQIITDTGRREAQRYKCNQCFSKDTTQVEFFESSQIKDLIDSVIEGYRACVFAFGQTGAGKTYTVVGPSKSITPGHSDDGLLGRSLDYMFSQLDSSQVKYTVRISCLEIYHENVYDLLTDEKRPSSLPVREHNVEGFFLEGSKMVSCTNFKQACSVIDIAMRHRHIGENDVNVRSNRSHCITEIYVDVDQSSPMIPSNNTTNELTDHESNATTVTNVSKVHNRRGSDVFRFGKLSIIDLAGSERLKSSKSTRTRLQEAGFINKSLYVLGKVIAGLARTHGDLNHRDVPYRDSKLTKLLINSLGGRGRTMLIACITEASGCQQETLRTLKFSMSCARIKNRPVRFLDPQQKLIVELRDEIQRLRKENRLLRTSLVSAPSAMQGVGQNSSNDDHSVDDSSERRIMSARENKLMHGNSFIGEEDEDDYLLVDESKKSPAKTNYRSNYQSSTNYRSNYGGFGKDHGFNGLRAEIPRRQSHTVSPAKKAPIPQQKKMSTDDKIFESDKRLQSLQDRLAKLEAEESDTPPQRISRHPATRAHQAPLKNNFMAQKKKKTPPQTSEKKNSSQNDGDAIADLLDAIDNSNESQKPKKSVSLPTGKKGLSALLNPIDIYSKKVSPYVAHLVNKKPSVSKPSAPKPVQPPLESKPSGIPKLQPNKASAPVSSKPPAALPKTKSELSSKNSTDDLFASFLDGLDSDSDDDSTTKKKKKEKKASLTKPSNPAPTSSSKVSALPIKVAVVADKLNQLEQQLVSQREAMEDYPGYVTADEERNLEIMEKEAVSLRMELSQQAAEIGEVLPSKSIEHSLGNDENSSDVNTESVRPSSGVGRKVHSIVYGNRDSLIQKEQETREKEEADNDYNDDFESNSQEKILIPSSSAIRKSFDNETVNTNTGVDEDLDAKPIAVSYQAYRQSKSPRKVVREEMSSTIQDANQPSDEEKVNDKSRIDNTSIDNAVAKKIETSAEDEDAYGDEEFEAYEEDFE